MKNEKMIKIIFNLLMFIIGVAILLLLLNKGESKSDKIDVKVYLNKKPETRNYYFNNPTVYKERTIEYNTGHILTKVDSDLIVKDYLKERIYMDSVCSDTAKIRYKATVAKNALKNIELNHSYRAKIIEIKETKIKNGINIGLTPGWHQGPTIGFYGGFETNNYSYGIMYDPIKNPQGAYLVINKRLFFKK